MNSYALKDTQVHHWLDAPNQQAILAEVAGILRSGDYWLESLIFGLDDQEPAKWYATAVFCT